MTLIAKPATINFNACLFLDLLIIAAITFGRLFGPTPIIFASQTDKATVVSEGKDKELTALLETLGAAANEIEVDGWLQLIEGGKLKVGAQALLEEAFRRASFVPEDYTMAGATKASRWLGDSDVAIRIGASRLKINRVALQCRVVKLMLQLSAVRALELFDQIRLPATKLNCNSAFRPDLSEYYQTALALFLAAFDFEARKKGDDLQWLGEHTRVSMAVQIAPIADLIVKTRFEPSWHRQALGKLASDLLALQTEDRAFTAVLPETAKTLQGVARWASSKQLPYEQLVKSWAQYLKSSIAGPRCADNLHAEVLQDTRLALGLKFPSEVPPFEASAINEQLDLTPAEIISTEPMAAQYWSSGTSSKLMESYKLLRFGGDGDQNANSRSANSDSGVPYLPFDSRNGREWIESAERFVRNLEDWRREDGETAISHFAMRSELYSSLLEIVPSETPLFKRILTSYVSMLRSSTLKREFPAVWLFRFRDLTNKKFVDLNQGDGSQIWTAVYNSGDSSMVALLMLRRRMGPR